ncbi:uncharacterized protein LOC141721352 isoform X3 [Apium graveolens]|uniref:uncharacterized protein LOC141721352 isoform X3 n=1 Tax=Apium graveolens TaxID=4045 RepID=UPI003D7BD3CD
MAAGQQKKRLNSANGVGYTHQEQNNLKRKKVVSSLKTNIILEWDDKGKNVVAKKEQVGIAQRDLSPFVDALPSCHSILADVVNIPQETFEIENLTEVLSYEVWQTHLSDKERELLAQFLPKGHDAQEIVQDLLEGDNFHFGNPYLKWGASLCSGYLHPDVVLNKERFLKASKKAYYSELQSYHYDMIRDLQILKERWSQNDIEHNLWSICRNGFMEDTYDNASDGVKVVPRPRIGGKLQNANHQCGDGAKYMSYIKVSKEQHRRVKNSMKHFSNSIQSKSLNHVLGDLHTYYIQPYGEFEEEERQKLHVHWSKLANVDIAAAHTNLRSRQIKKQQVIHALGREMVAKLNYLKENEEKKTSCYLSDPVGEDSDPEPSTSTEDEDSEISNSFLEENMDNAATNHESSLCLEVGEHRNPACMIQQHTDIAAVINGPAMDDETGYVSTPTQNHQLQHNPLPGGNHVFNPMDFVSDDIPIMPEPGDLLPNVSKFTENVRPMAVPCSQETPLSVACDVWPAVSMSNAYYNSTHVSHDYASANELSNGHSQILKEHPTQLLNLKSDMHEVNLGKELSGRQSNDIFSSSYPNQVQNQQFELFSKGLGTVQYLHEQKPRMLDVQPVANMMIDNSQLVGNFTEQLHPSMALDLGRNRLMDPFIHESIQESMYLNGLRHALPSNDHFSSPLASPTLNMQSWGANSVQHPGLSQSHPNGGELLSQNWVSVDNNDCGSWSGLEANLCQNQNFGNGSIADQSLFSVLSQCNNMNPSTGLRTSFPPQERFTQSVNHSGGVIPATSNLIPGMVNQHIYLNGHENINGLKANTGWTGLPHQNTALHDSLGKPYLRYWNQ